jgi:hypothetical protein
MLRRAARAPELIPFPGERILERSYGVTATCREAKVGAGAMQRQTARPIRKRPEGALLQLGPSWWGPFGRLFESLWISSPSVADEPFLEQRATLRRPAATPFVADEASTHSWC